MKSISPRNGLPSTTTHLTFARRAPKRTGRVLAGMLLMLPLTAGCVSQTKIQDYQNELRSLREERTQLKKENRGLRTQLEEAQSRLIEASSRPMEEAAPAAKDYAELEALGIDYGTRDGNFMISLPAEITFPSGSATLSKQGQQALSVVASTLAKDYPGATYWIEGHTDNDPIRKSKWESNRQLSVYRAMAVHAYLVEEAGFSDDQFVVAGHGEYLPIVANDSPAGKARNRRVEIVVHKNR